MLTYEEARYILSLHLMKLEEELCTNYTREKFQTVKALEIVLDHLEREIDSYRNI